MTYFNQNYILYWYFRYKNNLILNSEPVQDWCAVKAGKIKLKLMSEGAGSKKFEFD
jgi:hypothetical protein